MDARTGEPLAGAELKGGRPGRSNEIKGKPVSGRDGAFRLVYPKKIGDNPGRYDYYTFWAQRPGVVQKDEWATDKGDIGEELYLEYEERRPRPTAIGDIRLVPQFAYIEGRVVDADTGAPLGGITVRLRRPGRWLHRAKTDASGQYRMRVNAYTGRRWPCVETTPEAFRPESRKYMERQTGYALSANFEEEGAGADYQEVNTAQLGGGDGGVAIPVLSSVTPDLFTRVDFRLPKKGSRTELSAQLVQVTPPGGTVAGRRIWTAFSHGSTHSSASRRRL